MAKEREDNPAPLERMRKSLYTPGASFDIKPSSLSAKQSTMPRTWAVEEAPKAPPVTRKLKLSGSALFLIGAVGFFVIAGLIAFFLVILSGGSVSTDRVKISIENPPTSIAGGDTVSLFLLIKNENPAAITDARLLIDFPEGTYSAINPTEELAHHVEKIGNIAGGDSAKKTVRATLFGEAGDVVRIPVTIEYTTEGSSAVFEKTEEFEFTIGTSPVSVSVLALSEVASGQEMTLDVTIRSNSPTPIDNVAIRAEYPFGFSVTESTPSPSTGSLFKLGTLRPGEERKISIAGTLTGQDKDERVFKFSAGTAREDGSPNLGVSFIAKEAFVEITRPFIAVSLLVAGSEAETTVIRPGTQVQNIVSWTNTLATQIQDAEIAVKLSGAALDRNSISTSGGFYRSSDTTILFNRDTSTELRTLQPGDNGSGSFSFSTKPNSELSSLHNPSISISVSVAGRRVGESGVTERVTSSLSRTVQVASQLGLSATASHTSGPFPPVPNQESTYKVRMRVDNGVNTVADAVVKAALPTYVRYVGNASSGVSYNEATREIIWTIGEIPAHAENRNASFDLAFLPSSSQSGETPEILTGPILTGFDRFVQKTVTATGKAIDAGQRVK